MLHIVLILTLAFVSRCSELDTDYIAVMEVQLTKIMFILLSICTVRVPAENAELAA